METTNTRDVGVEASSPRQTAIFSSAILLLRLALSRTAAEKAAAPISDASTI